MNNDKNAKIDSLQKQADMQQQINADLQKQINELRTVLHAGNQTGSALAAADVQKTINISSASLGQNIPNPFNSATSINYTLPTGRSKALLNIIDYNGNTVKQVSLTGNGKGVVNIEASTLSVGTYSYALNVDGKTIATKKMVIAR